MTGLIATLISSLIYNGINARNEKLKHSGCVCVFFVFGPVLSTPRPAVYVGCAELQVSQFLFDCLSNQRNVFLNGRTPAAAITC